MKVLIARMNHETNTFSPVPTPLSAFGLDGPTYDADAYAENHGKRTAMSAFIDLAEARGAELVTPVSATAYPSGRVAADAYDAICERIVAAAPGCGAILLDLHGAMAVESTDDGEGDLLERVRRAAPGVPIGVALDLHGNVTPKMVANADVIISFKTYPHIDMYETGEHAGRLLFDSLDGRIAPFIAWRRLPLVSHTLRSNTGEGAMREAVEAARRAEAEGALGVSVLAGFGLADIPHPCLSVVAVADGSQEAAERVATDMAAAIWARRAGFLYESEPLAQSLARARQLAEGADKPVLLLDHGDNCMSGGTCDTMDVLMAAVEAGLEGIVAGLYCDPDAVETLTRAGVGAEVELPVGNKRPIDSIGRPARPVALRGTVRALTNGEYVITGPTYTGQLVCMGRSAVLDIGAARLVITERTHEPWDLGVFRSLGVEPTEARYILVKSRMYCRPVFVPISSALVECDSPGVTSSDWSLFGFRKRVGPHFPLEPLAPEDYDARQAPAEG
jgi:microcystin degradation protein MlrC